MPSEKTSNLKLGVFVTIAAILFTTAVYYIGSQQNLFGSRFMIRSTFNNINGLQKGNNVRYSGINVGNVEEILILNDSLIQVDMLLDRAIQKFVKKDAIASIGSDGLVGNMIVNITAGKGAAPGVQDGDLIDSYTRIKTDDMIGTLGKTTENIEILSNNLLEISERFMESEGIVSKLISDANLATEMEITFVNLRKTSQQIQQLSAELSQNIAASSEGKGALGYLFTDSLLGEQVNKITAGMDTLISIRTVPIMENLKQSSEDISVASAELKRLLEDLNFEEGMAGALLKDESVKSDFEQMMQNLNEGTDRFSENMEALKHNFLFRRYFKKQERKKRKAEQNDSNANEAAFMNN